MDFSAICRFLVRKSLVRLTTGPLVRYYSAAGVEGMPGLNCWLLSVPDHPWLAKLTFGKLPSGIGLVGCTHLRLTLWQSFPDPCTADSEWAATTGRLTESLDPFSPPSSRSWLKWEASCWYLACYFFRPAAGRSIAGTAGLAVEIVAPRSASEGNYR